MFPQSTLQKVKQGTANQRAKTVAQCPEEGCVNRALQEKLKEPPAVPPEGRLRPIAAKILMKVFYAARLARFDLLRAVANLARYITNGPLSTIGDRCN